MGATVQASKRFVSAFEDSQRDEEVKRPSFLTSRGASASTLQSFILYIGAMNYCCLCSAMIQTDCALRAYYIPSIAVAKPTEPAHTRFLLEKSLDSTAIELKFSCHRCSISFKMDDRLERVCTRKTYTSSAI